MNWVFPQALEPNLTEHLADALQLPVSIAELLARRGFGTPDSAKQHLSPKLAALKDPFLLPDMHKAVERIFKAIDAKERIVLFGDYDVDGVSSLALLYKILRAYEADVHCFLPVRTGEGYGLSEEGLQRCRQAFNPELLVAVDCGTSSAKEVAALRAQGLGVVILDHHECPAVLPDCEALVNPKRGGPHQYLCSVGIAFKMAHALLKTRRIPGLDLREYLDFVALGTLADLVPLIEENRILVRRGLEQLGVTRWAGLQVLMEVAGVSAPVTSGDVGFKLAPRMNAAGRLGTAQDALEILLTEDLEKARAIALSLESQNRDRRSVEDRVFQEAEAQLTGIFDPEKHATIVVGADGWHPGVVGIVASRIMRRYYRPTFVVGFDENGIGKGSGRSIRGLALVEALKACSDALLKFGGHEMAAGISVKKEEFERFREIFGTFVKSTLDASLLEPLLEIDAELLLEDVNTRMLSQYEALAPFGMGNPQPLFAVRGVTPSGPPRKLKEKHLQLSLRQGGASARAIWFNAPPEPLPPSPWDIAFEISRNEFQGKVSAQILIKAIRSAG